MTEPLQSEALLQDATSGDERALAQLLEHHVPGLRAFVRLRMGPAIRAKESSSDLVQSVCREVLLHADRYQHGGELGFKRWLYRTALRKLANRGEYYEAAKRDFRRERPIEPTSSSEQGLLDYYRTICTPSHHAAVHEAVERMERAFEELPDHYREVILGARILELSHAELAEQMGRSEASVRVLLFRALRRLADLVQGRADNT